LSLKKKEKVEKAQGQAGPKKMPNLKKWKEVFLQKKKRSKSRRNLSDKENN